MCGFFLALDLSSSKILNNIDTSSIYTILEQRSDSASSIHQSSFSNNHVQVLSIHSHLSISRPDIPIQYPLTLDNSKFLFNGEIYTLEGEPIPQSSPSDGHSLLDYLHFNLKDDSFPYYKLFADISGQFAFAYINHNSLFLARDLFGQKPLFWSIQQNILLISSLELPIINAILSLYSLPLHSSHIRPLCDYPSFPNIHKVAPGTLLNFSLACDYPSRPTVFNFYKISSSDIGLLPVSAFSSETDS